MFILIYFFLGRHREVRRCLMLLCREKVMVLLLTIPLWRLPDHCAPLVWCCRALLSQKLTFANYVSFEQNKHLAIHLFSLNVERFAKLGGFPTEYRHRRQIRLSMAHQTLSFRIIASNERFSGVHSISIKKN